MGSGKLYKFDGNFIVGVNYQFFDQSETSWWGELVPKEYCRLSDGDGYTIELEGGLKGHCSLRKRINKAVSGVPPLYYYTFRGHGFLE
ncbi:hypothetical protein ACFLXT_01470 [Chloroflexota bacterium]